MPYAIQQPAISEQMQLLEERRGCRLFIRHPFRLTPQGRVLYENIFTFFNFVEKMDASPLLLEGTHLRIAADDIFIQHRLPEIARSISQVQPEIQLSFRSGPTSEMYQWLLNGDVDLVVVTIARPGGAPRGLGSKPMFELPLVLLVDTDSSFTSAAGFWETKEITHPLVCSPSGEAISEIFQRGLRRGDLTWRSSITASSIGSVAAYVANTDHVGVSLGGLPIHSGFGIRELPLPGFDLIQISVVWSCTEAKRLKSVIETFPVGA